MDDRVISVDSGNFSGIRRVVIVGVVVMIGRPVAVTVNRRVGVGVHVKLGRLHVHQRESGNQRERE